MKLIICVAAISLSACGLSGAVSDTDGSSENIKRQESEYQTSHEGVQYKVNWTLTLENKCVLQSINVKSPDGLIRGILNSVCPTRVDASNVSWRCGKASCDVTTNYGGSI